LIEYTESQGSNHDSIEAKVLEISQSCQLSSPYIQLAETPLDKRNKRIQDMEIDIKKQYYYKDLPNVDDIQTMLSRRSITMTIEELNLSSSRFHSEVKKNKIPELFPLGSFTQKYRSIQKLYLSDLEIYDEKALLPIETLHSLELLDISFNRFKNVPSVISRCVNLKDLNAKGNFIADINGFSPLKGLTDLEMRFNPCCSLENYRELLGQAIHSLKVLNGVPIVVYPFKLISNRPKNHFHIAQCS
jgi:Leucine-rich repeat (LRR) protein